MRVAADRIDVQLVTATGRLRSVQLVPGRRLRTLSLHDLLGRLLGPRRGGPRGHRPRRPQRLARAAARRARLPATRIDYLVLSTAGGTTRWIAFLRNGPAYLADRTGRIERAIR